MVAQYEIEKSLKRLEANFDLSNSPVDQRYLSKVALIELCGWVEEEVDKLMLKYGKKCLKGTEFSTKYEEVVLNVYGFDYERHFRKMLVQLFGMYGTYHVEQSVGDALRIQLKSVLGGLKTRRDKLAHHQLKGQTAHLMGFSVLLNNQKIIYSALTSYEQAIKKYLE